MSAEGSTSKRELEGYTVQEDMALPRSLYRSLLRLALKFDKNPAAKLLFYRRSLSPAPEEAAATAKSFYLEEIVPQVFVERTQAKLFHPKSQRDVSLSQIVRNEFRRGEFSRCPPSERIDAAFLAIRKLSSLWRYYSTMETAPRDRSSKRERAQSGPEIAVTETSTLLPGTILVSHPMIQGPLKRAVILLLEHTTAGSYGVVINRPTDHTIKTSVRGLPSDIFDAFATSSVGFGGMVRRLQYLHKYPSLSGSPIPLCKSPFFAGGNIGEAVKMVKSNPSSLEGFRFYVGCCTWDAQELSNELETGYWLPLHGHADEIVALANSGDSTSTLEGSERKHGKSKRKGKSTTQGSESGGSAMIKGLDGSLSIEEVLADSSRTRFDLWSYLVGRLGNPYRPALALAPWVDASSVESLD